MNMKCICVSAALQDREWVFRNRKMSRKKYDKYISRDWEIEEKNT